MTAKQLADELRAAGIPVAGVYGSTPATDAGVDVTGTIDVQIGGGQLWVNETVGATDEDFAVQTHGPYRTVREAVSQIKRLMAANN